MPRSPRWPAARSSSRSWSSNDARCAHRIRVIETLPVTESAAAIEELPTPPVEALTRRDRFDARLGRLLLRAPARVQLALSGKPQIRRDGQKLDPGIQLALRTLERRGTPALIVGAPQNNP